MEEKQTVRRRETAWGRKGNSAVGREGNLFLLQKNEVLRKEGPGCGSFQLLPRSSQAAVRAKKMEKDIFFYQELAQSMFSLLRGYRTMLLSVSLFTSSPAHSAAASLNQHVPTKLW